MSDLTERLRFHGRHAAETAEECAARKNREREEAADALAALQGDLKSALRECSKWATEAGLAKGKLEMSEAAGIVDGWREKCEALEAKVSALQEEVGRLRHRLEIDTVWKMVGDEMVEVSAPEGTPDGIECRDETIRQLDAQVAGLKIIHDGLRQRLHEAYIWKAIDEGYHSHNLADFVSPSPPQVEKSPGINLKDLPFETGPIGVGATRLGSAGHDGWLPIKSAPKVHPLLLFGTVKPGPGHTPDHPVRPIRAVGYWDEIDEAWCLSDTPWSGPFFEPTHWRPLPPPPTTEEK